MAVLRMFASVKEVAGTDKIEVDVSTVGGLVAEADGRFGADFVRARSGAKLWLNGDHEIDDLATPIGRTDEVAIIPPVSGGMDEQSTNGRRGGKPATKAAARTAPKSATKTNAKSASKTTKTTKTSAKASGRSGATSAKTTTSKAARSSSSAARTESADTKSSGSRTSVSKGGSAKR
jgi:molybdopterin synthase sulfur carrier subunit